MGTPPLHKLPNENSLVWAIHTAVKGRARYKVSGLHQDEALKRYLELRLSQKEGIAQVRANHLTGNVLVIFHPDKNPNAIALLVEFIVLDYIKEVRKLPVRTYISTAPEEGKNLLINKRKLNKPKISPWHVSSTDSLLLLSGAVCTLVCGTLVLHAYNLDTRILLAIQKLHTPISDRIMLGITFLGDPVSLLLICLGLGIGSLYYKRRLEATTLGIAAVGAIGLNYLLKVRFGRARPALWDRIINVGLHSFPSGHAMVSMAIYGFIGYILAKQFPQSQEQIFALTVILIGAIGFSRLYLGVHWPTDVIAGYAVGLVWLIACIITLELWQKYRSSGSDLLEGQSSSA